MNFLETATDFCTGLGPIVSIVKTVINLFQWGIPILLVVFGILDLGKAVIASKEDEMKKAQGTLIKRVIYAVAIFLVVTIVKLVMTVVTNADANTCNFTGKNWWQCFFSDSVSGGTGAENTGD